MNETGIMTVREWMDKVGEEFAIGPDLKEMGMDDVVDGLEFRNRWFQHVCWSIDDTNDRQDLSMAFEKAYQKVIPEPTWKNKDATGDHVDYRKFLENVREHAIIVKLPDRRALLYMLQGFMGIRFYGLPDDAVMDHTWIDDATHALCIRLYHPAFPYTEPGAMLPTVKLPYRFRKRTSLGSREYIKFCSIGFTPTEVGQATQALLALDGGKTFTENGWEKMK